MKRLSWFGLPLILAGMAGSGVSWGDGRGHSHGHHNHSHHHHSHYSGRGNFSLGIGLTNTFGAYGRYGYPGSNIGVYGNFNYGRPYSYYRQPYYRPYGYYDYGYPSWPTYSPPVVVVPATPPVYIQQQPVRPPPPPESAVTNYWYYCEDSAGYYPNVERCPGGWIKVPPRPAQ